MKIFDDPLVPRLLERQAQMGHQRLGVPATGLEHILRLVRDLELQVGRIPDLLQRRVQLLIEVGLFDFIDMHDVHRDMGVLALDFFDLLNGLGDFPFSESLIRARP